MWYLYLAAFWRRLMKHLYLVITVVLLTVGVSVSQSTNAPGTEVVWQPGSNCSVNNSIDPKTPAPLCQRIETDRGIFYLASFDGVSVAISHSAHAGFVGVLVQITNHTGKAINFDPFASAIDVYKAESEFRSRDKGRRTSAAITGKQAEQKYAQSLYVAASPLPPRTVVGSPGILEPKHTTPSIAENVGKPPPEPPILPNPPTPTLVRGSANSKTLQTFDHALRSQTIAPEGKVAGYLFFEPVKERTNFTVLKVKLGDMMFVFPEEASPAAKK